MSGLGDQMVALLARYGVRLVIAMAVLGALMTIWVVIEERGRADQREAHARAAACAEQAVENQIRGIEDAHDEIDRNIDRGVLERRLREGAASALTLGDCP